MVRVCNSRRLRISPIVHAEYTPTASRVIARPVNRRNVGDGLNRARYCDFPLARIFHQYVKLSRRQRNENDLTIQGSARAAPSRMM